MLGGWGGGGLGVGVEPNDADPRPLDLTFAVIGPFRMIRLQWAIPVYPVTLLLYCLLLSASFGFIFRINMWPIFGHYNHPHQDVTYSNLRVIKDIRPTGFVRDSGGGGLWVESWGKFHNNSLNTWCCWLKHGGDWKYERDHTFKKVF